MDSIYSSIMKNFSVLNGANLHFSDHFLNRQGWPDFLTTWVKIRKFLSIMLLRLPCYSAYWWVVRFFWSSLGGWGRVSLWCDETLSPGEVNKSTTSRRRVVSLQSFEYFVVISMVHYSGKYEKLLLICFFTITLRVLTSISFEISWKVTRTRQRETNFATITSFPWSVHLSNKALHQSAHKKSLSYCKMNISHNYDHYL